MRLIIFFLFLSNSAFAQFKSAEIGIDGLTCSMCSNAVERLMRQLDFVGTIEMDLNENIAHITFVKDKSVNFNALAEKIYDAGYAVRFMKTVFHTDGLQVYNNYSFRYENSSYNFINSGTQLLQGDVTFTFLDKKLISRKDYPKWESYIRLDKKLNKSDKNTYHITL